MILVDANILLYAEDSRNLHNKKIRSWWDRLLSGQNPVCLCWPVILAFLRIATNHRVFECPLSTDEAAKRVDSWLAQPCVRIVTPTSQHWMILKNLLQEGQVIANLTMDAHLAALSLEYGCELWSTDADFARFKKICWKNPLRIF